MSTAMLLGFLGDFLTFAGGALLAVDAVLEERRLKQLHDWMATVEDLALARVVLTLEGVKLKGKDDVEHSFARRSARRARIGILVLTMGFLLLFCARVADLRQQTREHAVREALTPQQRGSDNKSVGISD